MKGYALLDIDICNPEVYSKYPPQVSKGCREQITPPMRMSRLENTAGSGSMSP